MTHPKSLFDLPSLILPRRSGEPPPPPLPPPLLTQTRHNRYDLLCGDRGVIVEHLYCKGYLDLPLIDSDRAWVNRLRSPGRGELRLYAIPRSFGPPAHIKILAGHAEIVRDLRPFIKVKS